VRYLSFSRATQKNVGTVLGLTWLKEAVEQMGGKKLNMDQFLD